MFFPSVEQAKPLLGLMCSKNIYKIRTLSLCVLKYKFYNVLRWYKFIDGVGHSSFFVIIPSNDVNGLFVLFL